MTIHPSKDTENAINAAVQSGRFASADAMVDQLVLEYARRTPQKNGPAVMGDEADADPLLGSMRDHAELMDQIVEDAMRNREHQPWRTPAGG